MHLDALSIVRSALAERYAVEEEIGRGGMAYVWRARDLRNDREVALKLLFPELARAVGGERFLREIQILARLSHPNILPLLDSGIVEIMPGLLVPWYVMPLVAEETLRARLTREGPLPLPLALRYTRELASALAHAHAQGYIHRDIKPENVLLRDDQAVLADFGIARAVTVASGTALSSTGLVVGTPAYMSPEQSLGSEKVDARSDLYSLGVVLYEMLAGHPPFTGHTPQAISARHQFETPPPIGVVRPGLPSGVEALVEKLLAKVPADRFQSAEALDAAILSAERSEPVARRTRGAPRSLWWSGVAGLGVALAIWAGVHRANASSTLDPSRYVVLPFKAEGRADTGFLTSEECRELVVDAIERWTDVGVVSSLTVNSLLGLSRAPLDLSRAVAVAKEAGAGHLVWGEVSVRDDTLRIRGVLYDAASGREVRSHTVRFAASSRNPQILTAEFADLAYSLVRPGTSRPAGTGDGLGTSSLAAYRLYVSGDSALDQWNLELAKSRYRESLKLDAAYPNANLKLAQVGLWAGEPPDEWRGYAAKAAAATSRLAESDQPMATGLLALADTSYAAACQAFGALVARDSSDFRGWFGLGECTARNREVIPDPRSPSRWRFRVSYELAITAYARAVETVPLSHRAFGGLLIQRLAQALATETNRVRRGHPLNDTTTFFAYAGLDHDTLVYIPYPSPAVQRGQVDFSSSVAAIRRNRAILHRITSGWLRNFPRSVPALAAEAMVLELEGDLDQKTGRSAAALLREARSLSPDSEAFQFAVPEVRIRLKSGDFRGARLLADSLLTAMKDPTPADAVQLAGLAMLTGRVHQAAELAATAAADGVFLSDGGEELAVPLSVRELGQRLLAYAAFGAPVDSIRALHQRVVAGVKASVPMTEQEEALGTMLALPAQAATPLIPPPGGGTYIRPLAVAAQQHDLRAAQAFARRLADRRRSGAPGDQSVDGTFLEARLYLAAGDTIDALQALDVSLGSLQFLGTDLIEQLPQAAALGRAMALRAKLAAARGDTATAGRWGRAVDELWSGGDASVTRGYRER